MEAFVHTIHPCQPTAVQGCYTCTLNLSYLIIVGLRYYVEWNNALFVLMDPTLPSVMNASLHG